MEASIPTESEPGELHGTGGLSTPLMEQQQWHHGEPEAAAEDSTKAAQHIS